MSKDKVHDKPWQDTSLSPDERAALLLAQMTLEEKVSMVRGHSIDFYHTAPIARLGIPALTMTDGPAGIIGGKGTALPAPIALAATWDLSAAEQYGELLGSEAEATGNNVFLGCCMDIARLPVDGRLFEALGEDPILTGQMVVRSIQGVQRHPVVATAKHYNVNVQEEHRLQGDARLDERTLQEIYTLPFAMAVQDGHVGAAMGAYNKVNGVYACENRHLLIDILKQQLGFTGWVMSDYGATHSTVEAANAGLDQEMATPKYFGDHLLRAIQMGRVSMATLDDKVQRILRTMFSQGLFDQPVQISSLPLQEHGRLAREIAGNTNTGTRAGAEIAQVYLGLPASTGEPPKRLVGWSKVELEPGETRQVNATVDPNSVSRPLSYWNVAVNGWEIASGEYQVYVGASSRDIRLAGTVHISRTEKA